MLGEREEEGGGHERGGGEKTNKLKIFHSHKL